MQHKIAPSSSAAEAWFAVQVVKMQEKQGLAKDGEEGIGLLEVGEPIGFNIHLKIWGRQTELNLIILSFRT